MRLDTEVLKARIDTEINRVETEKEKLRQRIAQLDLKLARFMESVEALEGLERTAAGLGLLDLDEFSVDSNGRRQRQTPPSLSQPAAREEVSAASKRIEARTDNRQPQTERRGPRSDLPSAPENLDISALEEVLEATRPKFGTLSEVDDLDLEDGLREAKERLHRR